MDEIYTSVVDLPTSIGGYTIRDNNGDYNIILNARLSYERQARAYRHEMKHIVNGDFFKSETTDLIEIRAHKEGRK